MVIIRLLFKTDFDFVQLLLQEQAKDNSTLVRSSNFRLRYICIDTDQLG